MSLPGIGQSNTGFLSCHFPGEIRYILRGIVICNRSFTLSGVITYQVARSYTSKGNSLFLDALDKGIIYKSPYRHALIHRLLQSTLPRVDDHASGTTLPYFPIGASDSSVFPYTGNPDQLFPSRNPARDPLFLHTETGYRPLKRSIVCQHQRFAVGTLDLRDNHIPLFELHLSIGMIRGPPFSCSTMYLCRPATCSPYWSVAPCGCRG